MNINNKRQETSRKRISPKERSLLKAMADYEQHFDQLHNLGIEGREFSECMKRFIKTFWSE